MYIVKQFFLRIRMINTKFRRALIFVERGKGLTFHRNTRDLKVLVLFCKLSGGYRYVRFITPYII